MARLVCCMVAVLGVVAAAPAPAGAEQSIEWRLENPFRLFRRPEDTALHRTVYEGLSAVERRSPVLAAERRLSQRFGGRGWAGTVFDATCYDRSRDSYDACEDYILPKSHRILARLKDPSSFFDLFSEAPPSGPCTWQLADYQGRVFEERRQPCHQEVPFDIPYPDGARLGVVTGTGAAAPFIDIRVRDVLILGMGDSFGSGEGNPDRPVTLGDRRALDYGSITVAETGEELALSGYPAREGPWRQINDPAFESRRAHWWNRECHRSLYSYQLRVALQLAVENPQRAVTFVSFACSGAEVTEGLLLRTPVRECRPGVSFAAPAQFSSLATTLCKTPEPDTRMPQAIIDRMPELKRLDDQTLRVTRCVPAEAGRRATTAQDLKRDIDLVLLSIGGNDIGFTALVSDSMLSEDSVYRQLGAQMGSVFGVDVARKRLALLQRRYDGLRFGFDAFLGLSSRLGDQRRVILTGYPHMGYGEDGIRACGGGKGMEVFPAVRLDGGKVRQTEEFNNDLNATMAAAAGDTWTFVDGYREEFRTHGLCASYNVESDIVDSLALPRQRDGVWWPFRPSQYQPYAPRQRWYRTPNDAFLTANMHAKRVAQFGQNCSRVFSGPLSSLARQYWTPFQLFLASTYGGAFHPSAEGHARMADEVLKQAREILDGPEWRTDVTIQRE